MIKDERIEQAKNKIWAEMMQILYFIAILSFVVRILLLHHSLQDCVMEYVILILAPIYQTLRARQMGVVLNVIAKPNPKRLVSSLVGVIVVLGLLQVIHGQERPLMETLITLGIFILAFLATQFGMYRMSKRRQEELEKEYDDED